MKGRRKNFNKTNHKHYATYWDRAAQIERYVGYDNSNGGRHLRRHGAENIQRIDRERKAANPLDQAIALEHEHPDIERAGFKFKLPQPEDDE